MESVTNSADFHFDGKVFVGSIYNEFGKIPRKMNLQCRIDTFVFVACNDLPKNAKEKKLLMM